MNRYILNGFPGKDTEVKPTRQNAALTAVGELLGSNRIPALGAVQMSALLHYLFNAADFRLRFEIAEVVYRYDHGHPNGQDLFLACTLPPAQKAAQRKAEKLFVQP
jgi:hypothetical protein